MQGYDVTLKTLLKREAKLALRQVAGVEIVKWHNVEFPRVSSPRVDLFGETADGTLVQIEFQSTNDPYMGPRMGLYSLEAFFHYKRFPLQIVLYVGQEPLRMREFTRMGGLTIRYRIIDARDLDGEKLMHSPEIGDNIIALLARWSDPRKAVRPVIERIAALPAEARGAALSKLGILAGLRKLTPTVEWEVRHMPITLDLRDHPWAKREFRRGFRQGKKEVAEQSLAAERGMVQRTLEYRFGRLPKVVRDFLSAASSRELSRILAKSYEVSNSKELLD